MKNNILYSSNIYYYPSIYLDYLRERLADYMAVDVSSVSDEDLMEQNDFDYDTLIEIVDGELVFTDRYHDGKSYAKIRILTDKGLKWYKNNEDRYSDFDLAYHLMSVKGYTKRWGWKK